MVSARRPGDTRHHEMVQPPVTLPQLAVMHGEYSGEMRSRCDAAPTKKWEFWNTAHVA